MNLRNYLLSLSKAERAGFAERCGTSFAYLQQIGYGHRTCTPDIAINLERESKGVLRCEALYPPADWQFIRSTGRKRQRP